MKVLAFKAPWCGPCRMMTPVLDRMIGEGYPIETYSVDEYEEMASKFQIRAVPTLVLVDENNKVIDQFSGFMTKEQIVERFNL